MPRIPRTPYPPVWVSLIPPILIIVALLLSLVCHG